MTSYSIRTVARAIRISNVLRAAGYRASANVVQGCTVLQTLAPSNVVQAAISADVAVAGEW